VSATHTSRERTNCLPSLSDINKDHQISQRSASNITASWSDGPINKANLTAYDGDLAGMSVCWAGIGATLTMRLRYASSNTTFEEYLYNNEEKEWNWQSKWDDLSGAAGVGCVVAPDSAHPYIYAAFVNLQSQVEIYYRTKADAHLATTGWEKCKRREHRPVVSTQHLLTWSPQRKQ
jgi:hypothetical protein